MKRTITMALVTLVFVLFSSIIQGQTTTRSVLVVVPDTEVTRSVLCSDIAHKPNSSPCIYLNVKKTESMSMKHANIIKSLMEPNDGSIHMIKCQPSECYCPKTSFCAQDCCSLVIKELTLLVIPTAGDAVFLGFERQ